MKVKRPYPNSEKPLFSFVVVADTHVNEVEQGGTSPFITNAKANARARYVFGEIAAMQPQPAFVVHLGDIVHPVPSLPTFQSAVDLFKESASQLNVPLHVIPGNHDVGDKRIDWMPADHVCDDFLEKYRACFGDDFYAFDHENVRFIMLNSLLFNSGLDDEQRQKDWLVQQIKSANGKRVFLFMHYPPYIHSPHERGNYDNVDEPGRAWLLKQIDQPGVEAVFAGHVHNFWYDRIGAAEFYMLPSTAFLRHDFSEFYSVAPSVEFGRGDLERFGYFLVDVFEQDHIAYSIRTMGGEAKQNEPVSTRKSVSLAHPKSSAFNNVGIELRHPWAETKQITATGGVQEFGRKWARNDYPLLALWEMGVRLCKVPDIDLSETESRQRMKTLASIGQRFLVTTLGAPKPELLEHDLQALGVVGFEVNTNQNGFDKQQNVLQTVRKQTGVPIYFSRIRSGDDERFDGKHFTHFVKAGFIVDELESYKDSIARWHEADALDGITVRFEASMFIAADAMRVARFADELGINVLASLKLAGSSVADERSDDAETVAMLAQAMILSKTSSRVSYVFDTFMDVDRGYYPRHAFIDRRFNPRPAAKAFTTLNSLLSEAGSLRITKCSLGRLDFEAGTECYSLIVSESSSADAQAELKPVRLFDLVAGSEVGQAANVQKKTAVLLLLHGQHA